MEGFRRGMQPASRRVSWNALRYVMGFPLLIAAICAGELLSSPAFADKIRPIQTIKSALDMYETDEVHASGTSGGTTSAATGHFSDSSTNSYSATASSTDLPAQAITTATADANGFHFTGSTSQPGTSSTDAQTGFTVDFGVDNPLGYNFSGTFSSSSTTGTAGNFLVTLVDLDTGEAIFSHTDSALPAGFSTVLSDSNSTGGLSGTFLPGVTYRLTIAADSSPPGSAFGDETVTTSSDVLVAFEVPEPATAGLVAAGAGVMLLGRRRIWKS